MDEESIVWLKADLAGELPEYDWGQKEFPKGFLSSARKMAAS
jgi:hypothetical protein